MVVITPNTGIVKFNIRKSGGIEEVDWGTVADHDRTYEQYVHRGTIELKIDDKSYIIQYDNQKTVTVPTTPGVLMDMFNEQLEKHNMKIIDIILFL